MSFTSHTTGDVSDEQFGRDLKVIGPIWIGMFFIWTWLLLTYGHLATSIIV
ncbi:hypothetical protein GRS48_07690 [Halorubrum sp. JWXQ-INN 858]|uniref:hypothetical protein n=1 Tax=Halorubrum sp. JWXQ-INN 858 TaxID=2690782 RepID=UPI001356E19C|nr:hypothetical protein [Halorubrum sp. JWXQ-INN 858]MWV64702.1 hypothetical protein [Halorubrum sp. JWXQ-INN 858]